MKTIKFNKDYKKLEREHFTSIRDHDKKLMLNETVHIISPGYDFLAEVIGMEKRKLNQMYADVLLDDLEPENSDNISLNNILINALREFYPKIE